LPGWARYVKGVLDVFADHSIRPAAFRAVIDSTVPLGGGLSSSAALEVSVATLIELMTGADVAPKQKALYCQLAEHEGAGMPCGIMDQFISVLAEPRHLMLLDCRSQQVDMVPLDDPGVAVLIINSNVKHELTGSEYPERRAQCEAGAKAFGVAALRDVSLEELTAAAERLEPIILRRARHIVTENDRTVRAAAAIRAGDWPLVGELMVESHASMRDDFEISCPEIDALVEAALAVGVDGGVYGSRMTGGGFGGCTVSLVDATRADAITAAIAKAYTAKCGIEPTAFVTVPARGAHVVQGG
jgi:galactokinase